MPNFSSILKNKKIFIFIFLFFIFFLISPLTTNAWTCLSSKANQGGTVYTYCVLDRSATNAGNATFEITEFGKALTVSLSSLIVEGSHIIAVYTAYILSYVVSEIMGATITSKDVSLGTDFTPAWASVRDLANMLIVLGFVIIGVSTSLRIREYEAKKLLLPLILVALLINFSGLFVGLVIDASNIITKGLGEESGSISETVVFNLQKQSFLLLNKTAAENRTWTFASTALLFSAVYLGVAFTFIYLAILLIARFAILAILYVLSPLAFAFWAFPASKKLWSEWWNNFLKWCFVGVFSSFVLFLVAPLMAPLGKNSDLLQTIITVSIVLIFLFVGFKMTAKSSGVASMAAGAVMGLATGAAGLAMGAVAGGAKLGGKGVFAGADKLSGGKLSSATQSIKGGVGRTMERFGLKQTGTTALSEAARVEKEQKGMDGALASGNDADKARVQQLARTGRGVKGAAAMSAVVKAGQMNETFKDKKGGINTTLANQRLDIAGQYGAGNLRKEALKTNPNFAGSPEKIMEAVRKQSAKNFTNNVEAESFSDSVVNAMTKDQKDFLFERGSKAQQDAWFAHASDLNIAKPEEYKHYKEIYEKNQATGNAIITPTVPTPQKRSFAYRAGRAVGATVELAEATRDYIRSAPGRIIEKTKKTGKAAIDSAVDYTTGEGSTIGWLRGKRPKK
ncbi:MAG: hypothetical protein AAB352_00510 [Patescibacteria group bacterium]